HEEDGDLPGLRVLHRRFAEDLDELVRVLQEEHPGDDVLQLDRLGRLLHRPEDSGVGPDAGIGLAWIEAHGYLMKSRKIIALSISAFVWTKRSSKSECWRPSDFQAVSLIIGILLSPPLPKRIARTRMSARWMISASFWFSPASAGL